MFNTNKVKYPLHFFVKNIHKLLFFLFRIWRLFKYISILS